MYINKNQFNTKTIKLFDELVLSELELSKIIKNYVFKREYYEKQLKLIGIDWNDNAKNNIINNSDQIKFRTKNIVF